MFQIYIKGEFRCVKNVSIISQFKIPSCEKMQLHLVLFALFIYTLFKKDNAPVVCIHGPHLRG